MSNLDSSDHRTLFHFVIVHFKCALTHRTRRCFWTMFTYHFCSCSFLHDRALVGICRWHGGLYWWQWFLEVFLGPFSKVNDRIMPMSDAVSFEGPKTTGIQQRSSALSLTLRDLSSFSESIDDVMHCRWWDLQSLCNLTLKNVVFKVFHNLFTHSFIDWRASAHLYFWETLPL